MAFHKAVNNYVDTLSLNGAINDTVTTIPVLGDLTAISSILPVYLTIETEIIEVTSITDQNLTAVRGSDNTTAASHAGASVVKLFLVAAQVNELIAGALTETQKTDLTDGGLTTLHRHSASDYSNLLVVAKSGGNYDVIQDAIDYANTQSPSATDTWAIHIYPGIYSETITLYDYISLIGQSADDQCIVEGATDVLTFSAVHSELKGMHIRMKPTIDAQSLITIPSGDCHMHNCVLTVESSTNGIASNVVSATGSYEFLMEGCVINYTQAGSSAGGKEHIILAMGGSGVYNIHDNSIASTVADVDDNFIFLNHTTTSTSECYVARNRGAMEFTHASYSGDAVAILNTANGSHLTSSYNYLEMEAVSGAGTGTGIKIDSIAGTGRLQLNHNYAEVTGFGTNTSSYIGAGDTIVAAWDKIEAADGPTVLSSNVSFLSADTAGHALFTGGLKLGLASPIELPTVDGTDGQVLTTDGAGNVDFEDAPSPVLKTTLADEWYDNSTHGGCYDATGTQTFTNNIQYFITFVLTEETTFDRIAIETTTSGSGELARLGIYNDDGANRPSTLVLDAGQLDLSTSGAKELTIDQTLSSGIYWLCMLLDTANTCRCYVNIEGSPVGFASSTTTTKVYGVQTAFSYASLPATAGATILIPVKPPRILLRRS